MKKIIVLFSLIAVVGVIISGCSGRDSASYDIATAERAVEAGEYDLARSICQTFKTDSTTNLSATQLCRLSLLYMKLSDVEDVDINTAIATQCYGVAMKMDADSARIFYDNVSVDDTRYVEIMSQIDHIVHYRNDIYEDVDSLSWEL